MKIIALVFFTLVSFYVFAFSPKEAYEQAKSGKAVLIDVREENEIKEGMVDLALWFPLSKIENDPKWKDDFIKLTSGKTIYLYCRSGTRSGKVKILLRDIKIESENLGGFMTLGSILPIKKP